MADIRAHLRISGRVQGVFFRGSTEEEARSLGLTGWVRNCSDGSVEVLAEGDEKRVERLILWCHSGPAGARVHDVQVTRSECLREFPDFYVR
ncbi:MAG: acylphosphatase [Candidatus Binatia bacterium]